MSLHRTRKDVCVVLEVLEKDKRAGKRGVVCAAPAPREPRVAWKNVDAIGNDRLLLFWKKKIRPRSDIELPFLPSIVVKKARIHQGHRGRTPLNSDGTTRSTAEYDAPPQRRATARRNGQAAPAHASLVALPQLQRNLACQCAVLWYS